MGRSLEALMERSMESQRAKVSDRHREARIKGLCAALITACLLILVCYAVMINFVVRLNELREGFSTMEQKLTEVSELAAEYDSKNRSLQRELDSVLVRLDEAHVQAQEDAQTIAGLGEKLKDAEDLLVLYYDNVVYLNDTDAYYHRRSCGRLSQWDTEPFIISQISPYGYSACPECFPR